MASQRTRGSAAGQQPVLVPRRQGNINNSNGASARQRLRMHTSTPHYLLFSESTEDAPAAKRPGTGRWRIVLEAADGSSKLEAADDEELPPERLALLAVIRGLEAIPEPARVTLVTTNDYVRRGLRFGLSEWRENGWQWEHFGQRSAVKHADLWQRLDRALGIHQVQCRTWRFDRSHGQPSPGGTTSHAGQPSPKWDAIRRCAVRTLAWVQAWFRPRSRKERTTALCTV
jgi:ribonuclease HI